MLGFTPAGLSYVIYKQPAATKYTVFTIPKKSGGVRTINAPIAQLKMLQKRLANILYQCQTEIDTVRPRHPLSHAFRKNLSIVTNARAHRGRRYVLNLDLENFFPAFNFGRVRGYFITNKDFALDPAVATIIAQIACHNNELPQGSPCSPVISDLIAHMLDVRLVRLAKSVNATYSRYADDITFSINKKEFPPELAAQATGAAWNIGAKLEKIVNKAGFTINASKTSMKYRISRQSVTGLVVNRKVNVAPEYYKRARSMCHSLFKIGKYHRRELETLAGGGTRLRMLDDIRELEGILSHIHFVKDSADTRKSEEKKLHKTAETKLFTKFLFYRHFVGLSRPLIVCEGKTDNIHLKAALRRLPAFHPKLGHFVRKNFITSISFFRYSNLSRDLLSLSGGTGDLAKFIGRYVQNLDFYRHRPLAFPVIILIDNDDGAAKILPELSRRLKIRIDTLTDDLFYHVAENLYIIKTPVVAANKNGESFIESFFDPALLTTTLNGKTFQPKAPIDPAKEYGKAAFAEEVVLPNASMIDFSGFAPIFDRIVAAINCHEKLRIKATLASAGVLAAATSP